jgi:hypothetical protein
MRGTPISPYIRPPSIVKGGLSLSREGDAWEVEAKSSLFWHHNKFDLVYLGII